MSKQPVIIIEDTAWAKDLEQSYEAYMEKCFDSVEEDIEFQTLSGDIFCGCQTCITREQLFFLVPKIIEGYKKGLVTLEE